MVVKNGLIDKHNGLEFDLEAKQNRLVLLLKIHVNTNCKLFYIEHNFTILVSIYQDIDIKYRILFHIRNFTSICIIIQSAAIM